MDVPNCSVPAVSRLGRVRIHRPRSPRGAGRLPHISRTTCRFFGGSAPPRTPRWRHTHIDIDLGPVGILYGRVIAFYPLVVDELGCSPVSLPVSDCAKLGPGPRGAIGAVPVRHDLPTPPARRRVSAGCARDYTTKPNSARKRGDAVYLPAPRTTMCNSRLAWEQGSPG